MSVAAQKPPIASILIVDDNEALASNLAEIFTDAGFDVDTANDGETALRSLEARSRYLVLADIRMPNMNGLELLDRLRARHEPVSVLMMTAYADRESALRAQRAGALGLMYKPLDIDALIEFVRATARLLFH